MKRLSLAAWLLSLSGLALLLSTIYGAAALFVVDHDTVVAVTLVQGAIFTIGAALLWSQMTRFAAILDTKSALIFILVLAGLMRILVLFAPPHSTDVYRYVWDGRVQAAGINPYRFIPAAGEVAHLRDEDRIYPFINRKEYAPTIYPPMAQVVFYISTRFSETVTGMKLALLLFEAFAVWAIIRLLALRGLPLGLVALYAWHPLPIWEVAGSGHIDIVAVAFLLLAFVAAEKGSSIAAGVALAASVTAKYFPLAVAPALWRRWDWKMPTAFIATVALLYLPYLDAGSKVLGFLSGYADEGGLKTGEGLFIAALLREAGFGALAVPVFIALAAAISGALAFRSTFRANPEKPDLNGAFVIAIAFTVLLSPHHAWYFLWLIPFLCFYPSLAVLWLTVSATALYRVGWPPSLAGAAILYGPFTILLALENMKHLFRKESRHGNAPA